MAQFDEGVGVPGFVVVELRVEVFDHWIDSNGVMHLITSNGEYAETDPDVVGVYTVDWIKDDQTT